MHKYTFKFEEYEDFVDGFANNREIKYSADFDPFDTWEAPLKSFLDFLSSVYGYDISESITLHTVIPSQRFNSVPKESDFKFSDFDEEDDLK
jgi:hypothetical protein